ncbi:hypothetical protein FHX37_1156 [Haloactinospora alba]|uniref:Uncharacterized protein n=1 Tax=Haloactinospora alba TaxID=405555 RepID=A0A543NHH5_9ACTN|nr:hypothetical protein FHX37_1156 [Haloactinospora alba]
MHTLAVRTLEPGGQQPEADDLYRWMLEVLSGGYEFGLYIAEHAVLDSEGESGGCFREELLLWNGRGELLRETRELCGS